MAFKHAWLAMIAKYNTSKGKDNVCADLLWQAQDESKNDDDPPIDIDNRNYAIRAINSNLFELKEIATCKKCWRPSDDT